MFKPESQRKRGGGGDCGSAGLGADTAVAPVLGGGQVEAGDRPLGAPWLLPGEERKRWFTARFHLRSAGSVG